MPRGTLFLSLLALYLFSATAVHAQTTDAPSDSTEVEQVTVAQPAPAPAAKNSAGVFSKGRVRGSVILGLSSGYDNTYLLLGVGGGYYLANGLEVALELLSWLGASPTQLQITPELRYVFWQPKKLHPYVGAFYRYTAIENYENRSSIGGRFGVMYRSGRSYVGIGGVYNRYTDCDDSTLDCDDVYPEAFFAFYF